jgi:hypothetical protein
MKTAILLTSLLASASASAALAPYYQSAREIQAVLASPEIARQLFGSITAIHHEGDAYIVETSSCQLQVDIVYLPPEGGAVGAARFELRVGRAICLPGI